MDSTTTAAIARREGFDVHALSVRYGQRHAVELEAARRVAERLGIRRHVVIDLDLRAFGGSALTADVPVPKDTPTGRDRRPHPGDLRPRAEHHLSLPRAGLGRDPGRARHLPRRQRARLQRLPRLPARVPRGVRAHGGPGDPGRGRGRRRLTDPHAAARGSPRPRSWRAGVALGLDYAHHQHAATTQPPTAPPAAAARPACSGSRGSTEAGRARPRAVPGRPRMTYAVKEIFYTLQGEGANAGRPAVFCRFAGCNLWTRPRGRSGRGGLPVLRHRFRRHRRPGRRQVLRRPTALAARRGGRVARRATRPRGRSWSAPAASRCSSSTRR